MSDDANFLSIDPWPIAELAGQLVARATLGRRALIETDTETDPFERETDRFELEAWSRLELTSWLTPPEMEILAAPVGQLSDQQVATAEQGTLIASTIGWALNVVKTERIQAPTSGEAEGLVLEWAPTPWTPLRSVIKPLRLRGEEKLATERERWEVLLWRLELFGEPTSMAEDQNAWSEAIREIEEARLWPIQDGDLTLDDGRQISALDAMETSDLMEEAEVRLRSLNWVCGYGNSPVTAPLDLDGAGVD